MSIRMRILQTYDITREAEFWALEKLFADLERRRPDFPKGRRFKPVAGGPPANSLVWEGDFPSIQAAQAALNFFSGDAEHEALAARQKPLFREIRVEFLEELAEEK